MKRFLPVLASWILAAIAAVAAAIATYFAIVIPSCKWFWPSSNLCGIYGPFGGLISAVLVFAYTGRKLSSRL